MAPKLALKRYRNLMMVGTVGYVVTLLGMTYLLTKTAEVTPRNVVMGLVPGIFVLVMLYSIWRYLKETDEAARHFTTQQLMVASFVVLGISGVWGLLEMMLDTLPKLPVFWVFPIFFMTFGIASVIGPYRGQNCA